MNENALLNSQFGNLFSFQIKTWNVICELVAKLPSVKNHRHSKPLRPTKSMEFLSSLSRVPELSPFEETPKTNCHILAIVDEIGLQKNNAVLHKSALRRNSDTQGARNGILLPSLHGKDYTDKIVKHLHLKGHVKYLKKNDMVLFICSPM